MRTWITCLAIATMAGCGSSHGLDDRDGAVVPGRDGGGPPAARDGAAAPDGRVSTDAGTAEVRDANITIHHCNGIACAAGEACCVTNGACFDPARRDLECPRPPGESEPGTEPCGSNLDCASHQVCRVESRLCFGFARCYPGPGSGQSCGASPGVCGCDGNTWRNRCFAEGIGINVSVGGRMGPCGTEVLGDTARPRVTCARDSHCPDGQTCCVLTGFCNDPDYPDNCFEPPPATRFPCQDDIDCDVVSDHDAINRHYCAGPGCEGPGGCQLRSRESCTGELIPVCGCNGTSYSNACWAEVAQTRIAGEGMCE